MDRSSLETRLYPAQAYLRLSKTKKPWVRRGWIVGEIINRILLALALAVLIAMTFFIFFQYPAKWRAHPALKCFLACSHGVGSISMAIIFTCYADVDSSALKWMISNCGSVYFMAVIFLFMLFGVRSLIGLVVRRLWDQEKTNDFVSRHPLLAGRTVHTVLFLVLSFVITVAGFFRIDEIKVREYSLSISKPSDIRELDIIMMSDIHAGAGMWKNGYEKVEQYVCSRNPDVILIGGDLFDETTSERDMAYVHDMLSSFSPAYGTFFVYGNHDQPYQERLEEWLSELGVMTLNDKMVLIGDHIQLVGRSDSSRKDVPDLFESEQVAPEKPIITIQHRPTEFKQLSENGCDLVMAGHTHGISFPFCFLIAPVNDMLSGSRVYDSTLAVTSAGASAWGIHYKWPDCSDIIHVHITFTEAEQ